MTTKKRTKVAPKADRYFPEEEKPKPRRPSIAKKRVTHAPESGDGDESLDDGAQHVLEISLEDPREHVSHHFLTACGPY